MGVHGEFIENMLGWGFLGGKGVFGSKEIFLGLICGSLAVD